MSFGDKKINKSKFYKNKKAFKIYDIDINKILVSKEEPYGSNKSIKYFIGYNDNDDIRPLCIILPQMIGYFKYFGSKTRQFYLLIPFCHFHNVFCSVSLIISCINQIAFTHFLYITKKYFITTHFFHLD